MTDPIEAKMIEQVEEAARESRKMLLGCILLAREAWKDDLDTDAKGRMVLRSLEELDKVFADETIRDDLDRLLASVEVIRSRSKGLFDLIEHLSRKKGGR